MAIVKNRRAQLTNMFWTSVWLLMLTAIKVNAQEGEFADYQQQLNISGKIVSTGSDTLANLMSFWGDDFKVIYPNVEFEMHSEGSATAPPALLTATTDLAPMSRRMSDDERNTFFQRWGYLPTEMAVAVDAVALFVHRDNPLPSITLNQLAAIFSNAGDCIHHEKITTWGALGLADSWYYKHIETYGRNADSGSYSFFKDAVLCQSEFNHNMQNLPGSGSIVQAVSYNPYAIGFSGRGYKTSGVRTLPILLNGKLTLPSDLNTVEWGYPLSRYLYIYINKAPAKALTPLVREFMTYVLSKKGQKTVELDGYVAISAELANKNVELLAKP
jgi:phosphate transport system substrate-binding protein